MDLSFLKNLKVELEPVVKKAGNIIMDVYERDHIVNEKSDGSPVTAEDVVFSHNILLEKGIPSLKQVFAGIKNVESLEPKKVKFTFSEKSESNEMLMLAASSTVFSKHFFSTRDFADSTLEPMLGTGPYLLDNLDVGKRIVYKLNPDYWGNHLPINQPMD